MGPPVSAVVTRREAQRYARSVGDLDPVYFDEGAARAAGYDGLVAPPTFIGHVVVEGGTLDDLREDGLWHDRGGSSPIRLNVSRTMFGGEEWEFRAPVLVGDTVSAQRSLGSVEEKDGRSRGRSSCCATTTTFTNQRDEVVARSQRLVGIGPMSDQRNDRRRSQSATSCRRRCATRPALDCFCSARRRTTPTASTTTAITPGRGSPGCHRARSVAGRMAEPVRHGVGRLAWSDVDPDVAEPPLPRCPERETTRSRASCAPSDDDVVVGLEVWAQDADGVLMPGTATVRLPTSCRVRARAHRHRPPARVVPVPSGRAGRSRFTGQPWREPTSAARTSSHTRRWSRSSRRDG